jgi:hypothetical protein
MDHRYTSLSTARDQHTDMLQPEDENSRLYRNRNDTGTTSHLARDTTAQHRIPRKPVGAASTKEQYAPVQDVPPKRAHILLNWWLEIGACFLFIAAIGAVVATLYPYEGKPLPQWPYHVSINTVIAVYVTTLKTAVLFITAESLGQLKWNWFRHNRPLEDLVTYDSASRGPLGALKLLWRLRQRHLLASFAAFITVVITVIDPFGQLIIHYYDCSVPLSGAQVTIPRSNYYASEGGAHAGFGESSLSPRMMSAINAGVFSPGGTVNFKCVTGNCTFPHQYSTVAYCSDCKDITHELRFNETDFGVIDQEDAYNITISLPSGLSMTIGNRYVGPGTPPYAAMGSYDEGIDFILGMNAPGSNAINPMTQEPPDDCNTAAAKDTWRCRGYGASTCLLFPCVRSYNASVEAGELVETETSRSNQDQLGGDARGSAAPPQWTMLDMYCLPTQELEALRRAGYKVKFETRWLWYSPYPTASTTENSTLTDWMFSHNCLYQWDSSFTAGLYGTYLDTFMDGTVSGLLGELGVNTYVGPQVIQTIYNYGNVTFDSMNSTFANISDAMTIYLRQNGHINYSTPASGVVMHTQTCLGVRWVWLIFPAALVTLTLVFFVLMVISTRPTGDRAKIWKSSPLALIFHGLEHQPSTYREKYDLNDIKGMEGLAKEKVVTLGVSEKNVVKLLVAKEED